MLSVTALYWANCLSFCLFATIKDLYLAGNDESYRVKKINQSTMRAQALPYSWNQCLMILAWQYYQIPEEMNSW